jgi:hypothetical protein
VWRTALQLTTTSGYFFAHYNGVLRFIWLDRVTPAGGYLQVPGPADGDLALLDLLAQGITVEAYLTAGASRSGGGVFVMTIVAGELDLPMN